MVGGVLGIALVVLAVLLFLRVRKNRRTLMDEKNSDVPYGTPSHKLRAYGEMDGNSGRTELPGSIGGHEMGTEGDYNLGKQQPVHELQ